MSMMRSAATITAGCGGPVVRTVSVPRAVVDPVAAGANRPAGELLREQHLNAIAAGYGERDWAALGTYIMDSAAGRIQGKSAADSSTGKP